MEARFDRLEQKLDKLADAMVKLTEHSVRIEGQDKRLDSHSERIDNIVKDVAVISKAVQSNTGTSRIAERIIFIILAATASTIAYSLRG